MKGVFYILQILLLLLLNYIDITSQTEIAAGNVNGIWRKEESPYIVNGNILVARDDKLIIEPGVKINFAGHYKLVVNGILEANGTNQDSIYFTPEDTTTGWHGISFLMAEDTSSLEYCIFKYGKTNAPEQFKLIPGFDLFKCLANPRCIDSLGMKGGGIFIYNSNPKIKHCVIANNVAFNSGGGIAIENHSNAQISFCRIKNNVSLYGTGAGICCSDYSNPLISNCTIENNSTPGMGAGIYVGNYCNTIICECIIRNNLGGNRGGGIAFYTSAKPVVKNAIISGNYSALGGGIYIDEFYNDFREQVGKIDIRLTNIRVEKNSAEYGGGIWIRDTMGELDKVIVCYNMANFGGGIYLEHNPNFLKFSDKNLCSVYMNFAKMMGNDFFRLGGEKPLPFALDTFTVKHYSALNAEPVEKIPLTIKNFKLTQVNADIYVSPNGDDYNSGLSTSEPLKSLKIALLKILADSISPRVVYMDEGEYVFAETNDVLLLEKHEYVTLEGIGLTNVIFGTDRITVTTPWWLTIWAFITYSFILFSTLFIVWNVHLRRIKIKTTLDKKEFEARKLREVDGIKSRFFANISHEFRTPLTLIFGPASDIISESTEPKIKQNARYIIRNAKKLYGLVNQLLDLAKLESGKMKLETSEQNIIPIIKGLVLSFVSLAERKKITLQFIAQKEEIKLFIDIDKIEKIITNLLSNAFKFTPEGGKIEVKLEEKAEQKIECKEARAELKDDSYKLTAKCLQISISDDGIGIPKNNIDKIFDRFYRVETSRYGESEGTGIGLAVTKELVELHRGSIKVESSEGEGTTFTIVLPFGKDHLMPGEIVEKESGQRSDFIARESGLLEEEEIIKKTPSSTSLIESDQPLIMVVEDNADVRKYIISHLETQYDIEEAVDGEEGLKQALNYIPELIISDIMMPKMDGFELCKKLKEDERTSHIPIILLTAKATDQDKIGGYETGADDYIMKPFDSKLLQVRIKNLLDQRKRLREHFKKEGLVDLDNKEITSVDRKFLQSIVSIINKHIPDSSFNVAKLVDEISMNRRNLAISQK